MPCYPLSVDAYTDEVMIVADVRSAAILLVSTDGSDSDVIYQGDPLVEPCDIAVHPHQREMFAVSDASLHQVFLFHYCDSSCVVLRTFGKGGKGKGLDEFNTPCGLCFFGDGKFLAVCDRVNARVSVWDVEGNVSNQSALYIVGGSTFRMPFGVTLVDPELILLAVTDFLGGCVVIVSGVSGEVIRMLPVAPPPTTSSLDSSYLDVEAPDTSDVSMATPCGISLLTPHIIAVADSENKCVSLFNHTEGTLVRMILCRDGCT
eukprot:PhF_6_TR31374/c0_g1_i2/m.45945